MWLIVVGLLLLVLKLLGLGPVAQWSWWVVLAPFGAAVVWWAVSDHMGWTRKAAERREEDRQQRRRAARIESLGRHPPRSRFGDPLADPTDRTGSSPSSRTGTDRR